ncbi:MAG: PQQ-binding-like beta-propeller repeat protein [Armatimonadetes bacterium]|nr:PQQ-binding-like beta-propeller repeat protein [Armatimonadota bacterium]
MEEGRLVKYQVFQRLVSVKRHTIATSLLLCTAVALGFYLREYSMGFQSIHIRNSHSHVSAGHWYVWRADSHNTGRGKGMAVGCKRWEHIPGYPSSGVCSAAVVGSSGLAYVAVRGTSDYLYALDPSSGRERWATQIDQFKQGTHRHNAAELDFCVSSPAVAADGTVYVGSDDGHLYAINGTTGRIDWTFDSGAEIIGSPNLDFDGTVYFGNQAGWLYAVDGKSGHCRWSRQVKGGLPATPAVSSYGVVYFATSGGLLALDATTGNVLWRFPRPAGRSFPVICEDGVVITCCDGPEGNVVLVDGRSGKIRWTFSAGFEPTGPALARDGLVYVGTSHGQVGKLYALEAMTGKEKWRFDRFVGNYPPSIAGNGDLYITVPPKLIALDGRTGRLKWRLDLQLPTHVSSPTIGPDGTVYIGTGDGRLIAVR